MTKKISLDLKNLTENDIFKKLKTYLSYDFFIKVLFIKVVN